MLLSFPVSIVREHAKWVESSVEPQASSRFLIPRNKDLRRDQLTSPKSNTRMEFRWLLMSKERSIHQPTSACQVRKRGIDYLWSVPSGDHLKKSPRFRFLSWNITSRLNDCLISQAIWFRLGPARLGQVKWIPGRLFACSLGRTRTELECRLVLIHELQFIFLKSIMTCRINRRRDEDRAVRIRKLRNSTI